MEAARCSANANHSIDALAQALDLPPDAAHNDLANLLERALSMHEGNVEAAAQWLKANNNCLDGCSPVFLIHAKQAWRVSQILDGHGAPLVDSFDGPGSIAGNVQV